MPQWWIFSIISAFALTAVFTDVVRNLASRHRIVDQPDGERKLHGRNIPLLGGVGIYLGILAVVLPLLWFTDHFTSGDMTGLHFAGYFLGGAILMIGGYLDDRYTLPPSRSILFPLLAAWVAVISGMGVDKVTNPFGSDAIEISEALSGVITFVWLLVLMYTTKLLDGLDGLATGVSAIGAFMIALLALSTAFFQPDVAVFALIIFGALLGFLLWNSHPAKIFLGEGGSTFVGFSVGVLAVISGSKLATALLVMAVPAMDILFVIKARLQNGKPIMSADRLHLHQRLFDLGFSHRRVVWIFYALSLAFGLVTLVLESWQKLIAFLIIGVLMFIVMYRISHDSK